MGRESSKSWLYRGCKRWRGAVDVFIAVLWVSLGSYMGRPAALRWLFSALRVGGGMVQG